MQISGGMFKPLLAISKGIGTLWIGGWNLTGEVVKISRSGRPRATSSKEDKRLVRRYRKDWRRREVGRRRIGQELKKQESNAPMVSGDTV